MIDDSLKECSTSSSVANIYSFIEASRSEYSSEDNADVTCGNILQVDNFHNSNESLNCMLDDMLPSNTSSLVTNDKSVLSSSCDVETADNQNSTCKQLREIRAVHINKIIVAELNINSICNKFEELAENITKYVDILLIVETK